MMSKKVVVRACSIAAFTVLSLMMATSKAAELKFLWQAEVQSEQAKVYSEVSRDKPVVTVLNKGDFLNVILEISVLEDRWCRVAVPGQSEPAGYVLCKDLRIRRFDSKQNVQTQPTAPVRIEPAVYIAPVMTASNGPVVKSGALLNKDISDMSAAGLPSQVLIAKIKSSACEFDTTPGALKSLKASGIPDAVILAMIEAPPGQLRVSTKETPAEKASPVTAPSAPTAPIPSDGKTRVLVTDSQSWESRGGSSAGGNRNGWGGSSWFAGGARPQTAEIIKTLNERCPQITVTNRLDKADFVLTLDHEGGKGLLQHHNKIAVFNKDGDVIFSKSTISLGNSVKDACQVMSEARR